MSAIVAASKRPAPPKPSVYTKTYTNSPAKAFLAFCSEQRPQLPKGLSPGERETLLGRMPHQYRTPDALSGPLCRSAMLTHAFATLASGRAVEGAP